MLKIKYFIPKTRKFQENFRGMLSKIIIAKDFSRSKRFD
jgi:hypothetical protein